MSPYGVQDIAWHVSEWTDDRYEPYSPDRTGAEVLGDWYPTSRVLRGYTGNTFHRRAFDTNEQWETIGFRCVFMD
jgi:hypothetical protein